MPTRCMPKQLVGFNASRSISNWRFLRRFRGFDNALMMSFYFALCSKQAWSHWFSDFFHVGQLGLVGPLSPSPRSSWIPTTSMLDLTPPLPKLKSRSNSSTETLLHNFQRTSRRLLLFSLGSQQAHADFRKPSPRNLRSSGGLCGLAGALPNPTLSTLGWLGIALAPGPDFYVPEVPKAQTPTKLPQNPADAWQNLYRTTPNQKPLCTQNSRISTPEIKTKNPETPKPKHPKLKISTVPTLLRTN